MEGGEGAEGRKKEGPVTVLEEATSFRKVFRSLLRPTSWDLSQSLAGKEHEYDVILLSFVFSGR